jgi:hypothetical protein
VANASRTSESGGSLDKTPWLRARTTPGFGGPAGTFSSASEVGGAAESAPESVSSGVGKRPGALEDNRLRSRLEGEEGSSGRGLLGGMFGELPIERLSPLQGDTFGNRAVLLNV